MCGVCMGCVVCGNKEDGVRRKGFCFGCEGGKVGGSGNV